MFPRYRHTPIFDTKRKRCSICNLPAYSPAGIHPQCAIKLPEPPPVQEGSEEASAVDAPVRLEILEIQVAPVIPTTARSTPTPSSSIKSGARSPKSLPLRSAGSRQAKR